MYGIRLIFLLILTGLLSMCNGNESPQQCNGVTEITELIITGPSQIPPGETVWYDVMATVIRTPETEDESVIACFIVRDIDPGIDDILTYGAVLMPAGLDTTNHDAFGLRCDENGEIVGVPHPIIEAFAGDIPQDSTSESTAETYVQSVIGISWAGTGSTESNSIDVSCT
jgi:hypothetical protein